MKAVTLIRWALTFLLVCGVYTETGIFTFIAVTLSSVFFEMTNFSLNRISKTLSYLK